jgi:hypothetical protein
VAEVQHPVQEVRRLAEDLGTVLRVRRMPDNSRNCSTDGQTHSLTVLGRNLRIIAGSLVAAAGAVAVLTGVVVLLSQMESEKPLEYGPLAAVLLVVGAVAVAVGSWVIVNAATNRN